MNKHTFSKGLVLMGLLVSSTAYSATSVVLNGNDDGAGSLRAALQSGANVIRVPRSVPAIRITQPLVYEGTAALRIIAHGQTVDASQLPATDDIFSVLNGANLTIDDLNFVGSSFEVNESPELPTGGKGVFVNVPEFREGLVLVKLSSVSVSNVGNHGIHVSDCTLRDQCGGGSGGLGQGSPASVSVKLNQVVVDNVGFGRQDADGVRVDERGDGDIYFSAINSIFSNVGADGIELDEGDNGDVVASVDGSVFDSNGEYCISIPFVLNSACDDDGDADVDDGFDIDEAGEGSIYASITNTRVTNNFDEGLDFDEEDAGDIVTRLKQVILSGNSDEGLKASEEGEGDLQVALGSITIANNNGTKEGIELEEEDSGNVKVRVLKSIAVGGNDEELKVEQGDDGEGVLKIRNSLIDAVDLDGVSQL